MPDVPEHPAFQALAQPMKATQAPRPEADAGVGTSPASTPEADDDLVLPDGRRITLARPKVACQFEVYAILGTAFPDKAAPVGMALTVKSLMYIQAIDGRPVTRPGDIVEARALMNELGDDGTELVASAYVQRFILKSNLPLSAR